MGSNVERAILIDLTAPAPPLTLPDFSICSAFYGENLDTLSCYEAAEHIPLGSLPRNFNISTLPNNLPPFFALPFSVHEGESKTALSELFAYHHVVTPHLRFLLYLRRISWSNISTLNSLSPNDIRTLASQVIQKCVFRDNGNGGFGTYRFANMFNYLMTTVPTNDRWPLPASTMFLTLTVSGFKSKLSAPGNLDPEIPEHLASLIRERAYEFSNNWMWSAFRGISKYLLIMGRRGKPWWGSPLTKARAGTLLDADDQMTYECDAHLGSPSPTDYSHLEYTELGSDGDTVHIDPGAVTFLHQGSCSVAISSSIPILLTWQQTRLAISALIGVCMLDPLKMTQGGRAYYGKRQSLVVNWRRRKKRGQYIVSKKEREKEKEWREKRGLSGFNALPPHATITLFQQNETWPSNGAIGELESCTWKAIEQGLTILRCIIV